MARNACLAGLAVLLGSPLLPARAPAQPSEPTGTFTVEMARQRIAEVGAAKVAEQVSGSSSILEAVASGVASAHRDWLDVGAQLLGPSEGYLRDRLLQSFNYAIQHDAAAVLERAASGIPVEAVCGYDPFSAMDDPPKRSEFYRAVTLRERAISRVARADLAGAKAACLAALGQLRTSGAGRYDP